MNHWLDLARDAVLPVGVSGQALRRTEQRSIVLQLERLMGYPVVARSVDAGQLFLHGCHYLIEDGCVLTLNVAGGEFVAADLPPSDAPLDTLQ